MPVALKSLLLLTALTVLSACSGGDDSGEPSPESREIVKDAQPDPFEFESVTSAELESVVESNIIAIKGINTIADIRVENGEFSIDGGDFSSDPQQVALGQEIVVRLMTSAEFDTETVSTLFIGGEEAEFTVTTRSRDENPNLFEILSQTNIEPGTVVTSEAINLEGFDSGNISVLGGLYSINGGEFTDEAGTIAVGDSLQVRIQTPMLFSHQAKLTVSIGETSVDWSISTRPIDSVPNVFAFVTVSGAEPSTLVSSSSVVISGVDSAPITISGGAYSINGGEFTQLPGVINNNDQVQLRLMTGQEFGQEYSLQVSIGGIVETWQVSTRGIDTTPNAFSFESITHAEVASVIISSPVTVTGFDSAIISVTGGSYSINGGNFIETNTVINKNDILRVQLQTSEEFSKLHSLNLTIGNVGTTWNVTTRDIDSTPNAFNFDAITGAEINSLITSSLRTISGIDSAPITINGGSYSINGADFTNIPGTVQNNDNLRVQLETGEDFDKEITLEVTVGDVATKWSVRTREIDTSPDSFEFKAVTDVDLDTLVYSEPLTLVGFDSADITVSGGKYAINSSSFTDTPGTIKAGDILRLEVQSSNRTITTSKVEVTVGDKTVVFSATTRENDLDYNVLLTFPTSGSTVADTQVNVRAQIPSAANVSKMTLKIDGVEVLTDTNGEPWSFDWPAYYWADGEPHTIVFLAESENGKEYQNSEQYSVTVSPEANRNLFFIQGNGLVVQNTESMTIKVAPVTRATRYQLQYNNAILSSDGTEFSLDNLSVGQYTLRYRAVWSTGEWERVGPWSNSVTATVAPPSTPSAEPVEIISSEDQINLVFKWQDMGESASYELSLVNTDTSTETFLSGLSEASTTISDVDIGTYVWKVRQVNTLGQRSEYSNPQQFNVGVFSSIFGGSENDYSRQLIATKDKGYLVIAYTYSPEIYDDVSHNGNVWLFKVNATGGLEWQYFVEPGQRIDQLC